MDDDSPARLGGTKEPARGPAWWFFALEGAVAAVTLGVGVVIVASKPDRLGRVASSLMIGGAVLLLIVLSVMWRRRQRRPAGPGPRDAD